MRAAGSAGGVRRPDERVILVIDIDCFYVQCAVLRDARLAGKPVCIRQKNVCVTASYEARAAGVGKLMLMKDALERCPTMHVVNGEDLTYFRECSSRIHACIASRLGDLGVRAVGRLVMEEFFIDAAEWVDKVMHEPGTALQLAGAPPDTHVWSADGDAAVATAAAGADAAARARVLARMQVGAQLVADLRARIHAGCGFTSSGGVGTSKLAAKIAAGLHKPNQQTILPPWCVALYLSPQNVSVLPGVGWSTAHKLQEKGIHTVQHIRDAAPGVISSILSAPQTQRITELAWGRDEEPVKPTGAPLTVSDEDSFPSMTAWPAAYEKLEQLARSVLPRLDDHHDAYEHWPRSLRVTVRHTSSGRVSRSTAVPELLQPLRRAGTAGAKRVRDASEAVASASPPPPGRADAPLDTVKDERTSIIVKAAIPLLRELLGYSHDGSLPKPFQITLINVAFTNFSAKSSAGGTRSLESMFKQCASARSADAHPATDGKAPPDVVADDDVVLIESPESTGVGDTLDAAARQDRAASAAPDDAELVVLDDGTTDDDILFVSETGPTPTERKRAKVVPERSLLRWLGGAASTQSQPLVASAGNRKKR